MSIPPTPSQSIAEERLNPSFDIKLLTHFLDGGEKATELKEKMMLQFERDPIMKTIDTHDQDLATIRIRTMEKIARMASYLSSEPIANFKKRMNVLTLFDPAAWTRIGVHYGLFLSAVQGQATPEQLSHWIQKGALNLNGVTGCFAMTELGHGSNVAGLETTATYDEASQEFIIHTPTLTATKWWIGGAAHTCTHSAVYAQMIVKGKNYGVKTFIVQLRDPKTFNLMPGVVIGDCGAKMGRHGIDNGWIQFTHVRIPRSHMLMKHSKVSRDGKVTEPPLAQLAFGALINGRVTMVTDSGNISKKALTIAIRYAAIRRQFGARKDKPETKILDYVIHQYRLMPLLAQAFAMHFTGIEVLDMYDSLMARMDVLKPGDKDTQEVLDSLKELHGTSAGLKAFCTWNALNTIDQCRQALGGHGYSAYAGLASLYNDFAVQCTWEGDNTILTLQAGRYLIGCYTDVKNGVKQHGGVAYLNHMQELIQARCLAKSKEELLNLDIIGTAYNVVCANVVKKAGEDFLTCKQQGMNEEASYEQCSQARLFAAKLHSYGYLFHRFKDGLAKAPASLQPILTTLCQLYGLYNIAELSGPFLQYEFFNPRQLDWIRSLVSELCGIVRKDAIPLTDSFNFSDFIINSPLGKYDGNIYETYFNVVTTAYKPAQIPTYFKSHIDPVLNRKNDMEEPLELDDDE
ncbi:acyl-CoA dehydrogenase/oxidase C-terminal [Globomyces pollinis-pini]|nr:acyl-CoA dehydrogenase/oxidase C-terminal [Globomyces pollinis-pini]